MTNNFAFMSRGRIWPPSTRYGTRACFRVRRQSGGTGGASAPPVTNVFVRHTIPDPDTKFQRSRAAMGRATALAKSRLWAPVAPPVGVVAP